MLKEQRIARSLVASEKGGRATVTGNEIRKEAGNLARKGSGVFYPKSPLGFFVVWQRMVAFSQKLMGTFDKSICEA